LTDTLPGCHPLEKETIMTTHTHLTGKRILAVDDENDILETIVDILDMAEVDTARNYAAASEKIGRGRYDLAILDIMGVDGLTLLDEGVANGIPTVMLTAHAINPETLMASIRQGAISYLPKETLVDLDDFLEDLLAAQAAGKPPWKLLFDRLGSYFDERFGPGWKDTEKTFWTDFSRNWEVGRGIQARLQHDPRVLDKGI
jgi:CheY-like chemotaxis protein